MTRTFRDRAGASWTAEILPPSPHRKSPDPRVSVSFLAADGRRRLQRVAAPFDLEIATDEQLVAVLEHDRWGLPGRGKAAPTSGRE